MPAGMAGVEPLWGGVWEVKRHFPADRVCGGGAACWLKPQDWLPVEEATKQQKMDKVELRGSQKLTANMWRHAQRLTDVKANTSGATRGGPGGHRETLGVLHSCTQMLGAHVPISRPFPIS